jgi:hypothetical protein
MERFYLHSEYADSKDGLARRGYIYRVEDVSAHEGKLMTKSGVLLTPLPTPAATATPAPQELVPDIEPTPLPTP